MANWTWRTTFTRPWVQNDREMPFLISWMPGDSNAFRALWICSPFQTPVNPRFLSAGWLIKVMKTRTRFRQVLALRPARNIVHVLTQPGRDADHGARSRSIGVRHAQQSLPQPRQR